MFSFLMIAVIVVLGSAQPSPDHLCDPQTEYAAAGGQCCGMCAPGKRMTSMSICSNPVCEDCGDGEYQENYNIEGKCKRQPYCDPNKDFEASVHESKKEKITCLCKQGFHCSSKECITCVPHTICHPGQEVLLKGNQTQDTVCRPCPKETFSNTSNSKCVKWTECAGGFHVTRIGSSRADTVCEAKSREHVITGVVVGVLLLIISVLAFLLYKYKKSKHRVEKLQENDFFGVLGKEYFPVDITEEGYPPLFISRPTETDEDGVSSLDFRTTENGNCLAQEDGKPDRLSRQESQSQPS